jgi:predicted Zn-dependent protease
VAAGQLLDDDAAAAHAHARYARALAPRLAVVREASALTAYRTGDYAGALSEFRALRRMTGDSAYLPVMADCERGLGRPEKAIALSRDPQATGLDPAGRVELAIVVSGARRDRGEAQAALAALRPLIATKTVRPWTARLWYAYAAALLDAGQAEDARTWFAAVADIDTDGDTDAGERAAEISGPFPH